MQVQCPVCKYDLEIDIADGPVDEEICPNCETELVIDYWVDAEARMKEGDLH